MTTQTFVKFSKEPEGKNYQIYCYGPLLDKIQMAGVYNDSKTFVDMKLRYHPDETMTRFTEMMTKNNNNPTKVVIKDFVESHFYKPGEEFEPWTPSDWNTSPQFLDLIKDPDFKSWGSDLNKLWKMLGRKMIANVSENPEFYSIIPVPNPVIVPGGRFREFYYWDSYWIVRGLLYSEMFDTVKGMLTNFLTIVDRFGFIPNGGRVYYSGRSQPPLLAAMIKSYVDITNDDKFAVNSVELLEHEFQYWMKNHTYDVKGYKLAAYGDRSLGPRPESYKEDKDTSEAFPTDEAKEEHYAELKAAAESGMDFSSRWFINAEGTNKGNLTDLKTRSIIAVELNAILFWNARIIAEFYLKAGNLDKSSEYERKSQEIFDAIQAVLWNEEEGVWLDYDMINNKPRKYFVPTNLSPLWMKCYNVSDRDHIAERVLNYIAKNELDKYPGGVPNTLQDTGEQWDYPNVWPPMQYMLIVGLDNLNTKKAKDLSFKWADRWVRSNYLAYKSTTHMFEKYDARTLGGHGGGGEYEVQLGFGWSNGVIIELLAKYGNRISTTGQIIDGNSGTGLKKYLFGGIFTTVAAVLATTVGRFIW